MTFEANKDIKLDSIKGILFFKGLVYCLIILLFIELLILLSNSLSYFVDIFKNVIPIICQCFYYLFRYIAF